MIEIILFFVYISCFCLFIGSGIMKCASRYIKIPELSITGLIVTGIIALTVAVGWISIFTHIGMVVHLILLAVSCACAYYSRKELVALFKKNDLHKADYIYMACIVLIIAFAASRGNFHTDTGIYHAAAIRQYEEYGIIKGIANIQQHYGYNSSYLGFAALFTLSSILPGALHATTGFLMTLFSLDAFYHLKDIKKHYNHYADAMRIVMLMYVFINYTGAISPATDYGTMLMTCYFLCECSEIMGKGSISDHRDRLALLSVYGLFLATMKLSAALCVIIVILPLICFIKAKEIKKIFGFVLTGLICFAFYPVRNVILSGWLFYPFESIDLFNVEWKVPIEYSLVDSAQIKVWGKCLFDIEKVDAPISYWLPIWWEAQEHYYQMLIYAVLLSILLLLMTIVIKRRINPMTGMMYLMIFSNLAVWFFSAPFVRYGLVFLMAVPALSIAGLADSLRNAKGFLKYAGSSIIIAAVICFFALTDHYTMDNLVFIKHNLKEPYYGLQKPFEDVKMAVTYPGGGTIPVYYTDNDEEKNSYYTPPSSCYYHMVERSEPLGDDIKDGFKSR